VLTHHLFGGHARLSLCLIVVFMAPTVLSAQNEETNKALARRFYEQLWFSRGSAGAGDLVASSYVIHDIGERKGVREPVEEQKLTADRFWENGAMGGSIDFQIAEGDLVATRWQWDYRPQTWLMKLAMLGGRNPVPIINVFRFQDGKIVEIWNHRHDIDVGFAANILRLQGFGAGVLSAVIVVVGARAGGQRRRRGVSRPELISSAPG
jgi:predicted SnoaL-like aldol condensation-catalyzing enzyme